MLGFLEEEDVALNLGSCQTARALSRVSKPVPPDPDGLKLVGLWPRSELYSLSESVCAACDQHDENHRTYPIQAWCEPTDEMRLFKARD